MVEICEICRKRHETGGDLKFGGAVIKVCPDVPHDFYIDVNAFKRMIYEHQGHLRRVKQLETYNEML